MGRNILIGDRLKEAQEKYIQENDINIEEAPLGLVFKGTPVQRPSGMYARRESSFKDSIRQEAKRDLIMDREGIIEKREDGIYIGNSYFDNVTQKGIIEFEGPDGQIELAGGYNQDITLDDLANITAFRYGEKTEKPRNIFMNVNGVKVPVQEGNVTKEGLMNEYAKTQGYKSYKEMKETEKSKMAFGRVEGDVKSPYDGMDVGDWN